VRGALRRIGIAFTAAEDGLFDRLGEGVGGRMVFYPDRPRILMLDVSTTREETRISLDLRRHHVRAISLAGGREAAFFAQLYHGVVVGTLERVLMDCLAAGPARRTPETRDRDPTRA
jgi:hypothetical protein